MAVDATTAARGSASRAVCYSGGGQRLMLGAFARIWRAASGRKCREMTPKRRDGRNQR